MRCLCIVSLRWFKVKSRIRLVRVMLRLILLFWKVVCERNGMMVGRVKMGRF